MLRDIRYWNTEDVIEIYNTELEKGVVTFRIEHIVHMVEVKKKPAAGYKYDDDEPLPELTESVEKTDNINYLEQ